MARYNKELKSTTDQIPTVIYARYSSSGQREESIEGQIRDCREFARKNNLLIIGEYIDKALTGRTDRRPDFQRMLKDSEKGVFKVVLCWKMDRFARNRYDSAMYKYRLKKNGVRLLYAMESIPEGPEGIILESVMEGYAEYYSENLSQNVKRGLYDSALECKTLGHKVLGYRKGPDGRFEIEPSEAAIVRRIFEEYAAGEQSKDIIERLNNEGHRTATGNPFKKNNVRRIVQNKKYIGIYEFHDICVEGGIPAIVSKELFDKCNKMLSRHHHAPAAGRDIYYMLTTKIFCGECGEAMTGDSATSKSGAIYNYYTCYGKRKKTCKNNRVPKDKLEDMVTSLLIGYIHDDAFIELITDKLIEYQRREKDTTMLDSLNARMKDVEKRIDNLMAAIEAGIVTPTTKSRMVELESEKESLTKSIAKEIISNPELDREQILFFFHKLRTEGTADDEYKQMLVDIFLQSVFVYPDKLVLTFNYSGKDNKVTKPLIEKALKNGVCQCSFLETPSPLDGFNTNTVFFIYKKLIGIVTPIKEPDKK